MKRRKIALGALMMVLSLMAACLPWELKEEEKEELTTADIHRTQLLFEELTEPAFMAYLIDNASLSLHGSAIHAEIMLTGYGRSGAKGKIDLYFQGILSDSTLSSADYEMNGTVETEGTQITIENAGGRAEGLVFTIAERITATHSRLCYPSEGTIRIGNKTGTLLMIFPEETPFDPAPILNEDEIEMLRDTIRRALSVFPYMPKEKTSMAFDGGTAVLSSSGQDGWELVIRTEMEGKAISMSLSSSEEEAVIILGDKSITVDCEELMDGVKLPEREGNDEVLGRTYLEAFRTSNIIFALRGLINGGKSGVITIQELEMEENSFFVSLALSRYGLGTGTDLRASGILNISLSGSSENGIISADSYSASSSGLAFSGPEGNIIITLNNVRGHLEGGSFNLQKTDDEFHASYDEDIILGLPYAGEAGYGSGSLIF